MSRIPMKWILVLSVLMILASTQMAVAFFYSGNDLVNFMRDYEAGMPGGTNYHSRDLSAAMNAATYMGYVLGVCEGTPYMHNFPDGVASGQILAVVSKYLKNHPEKWDEPAVGLVVEALQEAFPLKRPDR